MVTREELFELLRPVLDPELGFSIVDLGLVYDAAVSPAGAVEVRYTLTTPTCPLGAEFEKSIRDALATVPGISALTLTLTFDPPWSPDKIAAPLRRELKTMGLPV